MSGSVTAVHFTDGAIVRRGQLLFTIDPRPFMAALAEARAAVMAARSELALAQADLGRAQRLLSVEAVSRSDVDRLNARVQAANASLAAAQARVQSRNSTSSSPRSARRSRVAFPTGGSMPAILSRAAAAAPKSLLTTINALDPIYFTFDASEALFLKARRARESGGGELGRRDPPAGRSRLSLARPARLHRQWHRPESGTIRARAVVANPTQFLTPGMFGNMRLSTSAVRRRAARPGCGGPDRPGAQDRAGRRQGRHGGAAPGRPSGRWSAGFA